MDAKMKADALELKLLETKEVLKSYLQNSKQLV